MAIWSVPWTESDLWLCSFSFSVKKRYGQKDNNFLSFFQRGYWNGCDFYGFSKRKLVILSIHWLLLVRISCTPQTCSNLLIWESLLLRTGWPGSDWPSTVMVHSHLRFSQLLCKPELVIEQWVTLYYMGAFTPAIWSTIVR